MITTYTVNIPRHSMVMTDAAINLFLHNNSAASVEDALDALFGLGVDTFIARCAQSENEVSA